MIQLHLLLTASHYEHIRQHHGLFTRTALMCLFMPPQPLPLLHRSRRFCLEGLSVWTEHDANSQRDACRAFVMLHSILSGAFYPAAHPASRQELKMPTVTLLYSRSTACCVRGPFSERALLTAWLLLHKCWKHGAEHQNALRHVCQVCLYSCLFYLRGCAWQMEN